MARKETAGGSLLARAILALSLMIGFYLLALGIVVGLGAIAVLQVTSSQSSGASWRLLIFVALAVFAVVKGIIPRRQKFVEPGPRLTEDEQPELFEEIRRTAEATESAMPEEVYLAPDVNAGVAHVGGFVGIGSRPIMILGLPLIAVLRVSELRGVIAHEFGHYVGGETKLAPLIYRTRDAISRTVFGLATSDQGFQQLLSFPFLWYGRLYLRATQAVSRRQELDADRMAARVAGGTSMESGLVKIHAAGLAFGPYMNELGAVLFSGSLPPVAEGFSRFLEGSETRAALDRVTEEDLREGRSDPYDSHPSLRQRLDALKDAPHQPALVPDPAAIELLQNEPILEGALLTRITRVDVPSLKPIGWDDVGSVWLAIWRKRCQEEHKALAGITPDMLPRVCQDPAAHERLIRLPKPGLSRHNVLWSVIGAALAVVLTRRGWAMDAGPGDPVVVSRDGLVIEPFDVMPHLLDGRLSGEAWQRTCGEAGIAGIDLGDAAIPEADIGGGGGTAAPHGQITT
ncbi:MAG: M48 family metallopeptidase [Actinomycetota bacterium]